MLWVAKLWAATIVIVLCAATYAVSSRLPASYSSKSTISVSVQGSSTISPLDVVSASNELASQVAQVITTDNVKGLAAQTLNRSGLAGSITAATAANQNLVIITVTDKDQSLAQNEARALAQAAQSYVATTTKASAATRASTITTGLADLDAAIASAQLTVAQAESAAASALPGSTAAQTLNNAQTALQNLVLRKQTLLSQIALDTSSQQSTVSVVTAASAPNKVFPEPKLYTLVALIAGLVVAIELSFIVGRLRLSSAARRR